MWLLNVTTEKLEYVVDERSKRYAILSHTWEEDEVTFHDIKDNLQDARTKKGYTKILFTCQEALRDELAFVWIDTCCINKESSAELSEAINSMYRYYSHAAVCYAFLSDASRGRHIQRCRWFTRGWTLQELLAPRRMRFFGPNWNFIGTKQELVDTISRVTRIDQDALLFKRKLSTYSIATKMSWAAGRATTRVEDRTYSLLGVFDANMPLIYGEGEKAFHRLQTQIISTSTDQTIFAWAPLEASRCSHLLADSPDDYRNSYDIVEWREPWTLRGMPYAYRLTNRGLDIELPVLQSGEEDGLGILQCRSKQSLTGVLALPLLRHPTTFLDGTKHDPKTSTVVTLSRVKAMDDRQEAHGYEEEVGLLCVPLEEVSRAELRPVTILYDWTGTKHMLESGYATSNTEPRVWIRTVKEGDANCAFAVDVYPDDLWSNINTFNNTKSSAHSGFKLWATDDDAFLLAFCVPSRSAHTGDYPGGLYMSIVRPSKIPGLTDSDEKRRRTLDNALKAAELCTNVTAKFEGGVEVRARATLTHRMGELLYRIVVTITKLTDVGSEAPSITLSET